jgi:hypothetical protein
MVSLYDRSDFGGNLDALRAHLFVSLKGDMRCLPPRCLTLTHQLKMPSYYTFAEPCISWLCVSGHTWFSQPTQLPLILRDNLSMANWWQPWCRKRQNLLNSNTANTAAARKACVPEDAPVQEPLWSVALHVSAWHCMSLCSRIELALEDRDMQEGRVCERDIDGGVQFFLRCCITQPAGLVCCLLRWWGLRSVPRAVSAMCHPPDYPTSQGPAPS